MEYVNARGLKQFRDSHALSLLETAKISGLSRNTLKKLESGEPVRKDRVLLLVKALAARFGEAAALILDRADLPANFIAAKGVVDPNDVDHAAQLALLYIEHLASCDVATLRKLSPAKINKLASGISILQTTHHNAMKRNPVGYLE